MDDEDTFPQNVSNPNFRLKVSKSSRQKISPVFTLANPLTWAPSQQEDGSIAPALPYVNHLVYMRGGSSIIAGFSSPSDSLVLFDAVRGGLVPHRALHTHPGGINAVKYDTQDTSNIVWSCGNDGRVQGIDLRAPDGNVCSLRGAFSQTRPFVNLDISINGTVAAGTEQNKEDASIVYWDKRKPDQPTAMHTCTHSQDINLLSFNASKPQLLLSGAADGLLSITDVLETDEDEAVTHVGNWGCSVARAGWMSTAEDVKTGSLKPAIWSTSDMETMAIWSDEARKLDLIHDFGDVRNTRVPSWKTDYIITAEWKGTDTINPWGVSGMTMWCGNNQGDLALLQQNRKDPTKWKLERVLQGGHSEIVRSICVGAEGGFVVTGAEDGKITVWDSTANDEVPVDNADEDVEMAPSSPTALRRKRSASDDSDLKVLKRKR